MRGECNNGVIRFFNQIIRDWTKHVEYKDPEIFASKRLDTNIIYEAKRLKEQQEAQLRNHSFPKVTPEEFAKIIIKDLGL